MSKRADRLTFKGEVTHRHEADELLGKPGEAALVRRGVLRSMVMACPDGCGEMLTINLDGRAGKAWRFYAHGNDLSLFPSVWRDSGCESHFILWRSRIYWCDWGDELEVPMVEVVAKVHEALGPQLESYTSIAERLELVPWAVLSACGKLRREGLAVEGKDKLRAHFMKAPGRG
ncbi:DUF6527 family protein [Ramlibacter sp. 2FC]|uniref:DUF6527 family protein n=1 Tax=Ramlibacter sp. 2FC TaxID=2502188 RepID=UPI0010F44DE9|nr:DUF6527 family protein [Ramlibacter sp. 2FC]